MKKLFALILLFITLQSQAQYPVTQYMGSSNVVVKSRGGLGTDSTFTFATSYSDTSALNRGFLKNIPGVMARVDDNLYLRSALADRWILLGSTSGGVNIYNSNGTLTGNRTLSGGNFQMDMTGFSDFNIVSNGGIGLSYDDGIYGSGTITHNTGAVGFDISHLASGESSIMNFGTGFLKLATDNSYVRVDQTDVKVSTASLQLLNIPRLGMIGKRVLVKDTLTNQVSEVAIDSLGGGGTQTLQIVTDNGDSTTNRIVTNDTVKSTDGYIHGDLYLGDTLSNNVIDINWGTSITFGIGVSQSERYGNLVASLFGHRVLNRGVSGSVLIPTAPNDSSVCSRWIAQLPTFNAALYGLTTIEGGTNDCGVLDTVNFKLAIARMIDTAVARGWPLSRIVVFGTPYTIAGGYTYAAAYATAAYNIAATKGVVGMNLFTYMQSRGGTALLSDGVHPTALGHYVIENAFTHSTFSALKRMGRLRVTGDAKILGQTFLGLPPNEYPPYTTYLYPYNAVLGVNGKSMFTGHSYWGGDTTDLGSSGILNVETSSGQTGLNVKQAAVITNTDIQAGQIDITDASNQRTRITSTQIVVGNGNLSIQGGANSDAMFSPFGGTFINYNKAADYDFIVRGIGTSYLINAATSVQRVGIKDSVPQQTLSVRGSGSFTDTLWGKGAVKFDGLTSAVGNKALRINTATGMISYADTTTSGGGSVTSVSGTTNRITSTGGTTPVIDISASYVGQSSITTMGTVTSGGLGTGATLGGVTPSLGSDATGDLYYRNSGGVLTRLPIGTSKQTLHVVGGIPAWRDTTASGSSSGTNLYVRINKTISDSIAYAPNDSTLVLKSVDVVSSDSTIKVTKTITDSTLKYSLTLRTDTCALASFAGGGANAGDTTAFTTSTIYGSFFNSLSDTLVITNLRIGLQGTSPSVGVTVYWNDSLAVTAGATKLVNAGSTATNIYTGTSVTSFDNTKIPPGVWVWVQTTTVTTKPTYMTATLIGYKKRTQ